MLHSWIHSDNILIFQIKSKVESPFYILGTFEITGMEVK